MTTLCQVFFAASTPKVTNKNIEQKTFPGFIAIPSINYDVAKCYFFFNQVFGIVQTWLQTRRLYLVRKSRHCYSRTQLNINKAKMDGNMLQ